MPRASRATAKTSTGKRSTKRSTKRVATASSAKKGSRRNVTTSKTATKRVSKKTVTTKKASAKRSPAKAATKKAAGRKATVKKAPKKAAPKKASAKSSVKKGAAKKAPPKKGAAKKGAAKKAPPKKATAKKAAPRKPAKSPFDKDFVEVQRQALVEERERLVHDVDALDAEATELAMMREPGDVQFDEESGEGDTLAVERERDLALSAQFRTHIEDIDHALRKIEAGTYGICEVSGLAIPKERLRAIPWARERVEYKVGGFGRS
jgi:RNA polymerase-binding transcription factor DksA